ncbi:unnamed protein product, partial [Heterotrigona itama]
LYQYMLCCLAISCATDGATFSTRIFYLMMELLTILQFNLLQKGRVYISTNIVNKFEQQSGIKVAKANLSYNCVHINK